MFVFQYLQIVAVQAVKPMTGVENAGWGNILAITLPPAEGVKNVLGQVKQCVILIADMGYIELLEQINSLLISYQRVNYIYYFSENISN